MEMIWLSFGGRMICTRLHAVLDDQSSGGLKSKAFDGHDRLSMRNLTIGRSEN